LNNCLEDGGVCLGKGSISVMHKAYWHAHFDNNGYMGIEAISKGSQSYKNIHACNNGHTGMRAKNRWTGATAGITLSRSGDLYNHFDGNGWNAEWEPFQAGLRLSSHGNVSVSYVTAEGNVHGRGGINIFSASAPANRSATVKYGMFNDNEDYGMGISVGGNITVMDVEAMRNGAGGAILGNDGGSGNVYLKYSSKGTNNFSENNGPGLEINTTGKVTMGNLLVENNARTDSGFDDLMLGVPQSRHEMFNDFAGPDRYWFYVPPGEIGTYNFYLKGSDGFPGVDLDPFNYDAYLQLWKVGVESNPDLLVTEDDDSWGFPDATFAVDFSLGPALYGYGEPGLYYLEVSSSEYYWWEEGGSGFYQLGINDPTFSAMNYEWIGGANVNAGDSVTVSGKQRSEFNNNSLVGLNIWTPGNITVKWAQARGNGAEGFFLDNEMGSGKISFTGSSTSKINRANGNGWQGAVFYSTNTVTLKNALANWNGMEGYLVGTDTRPTGNAVYLTDVYAGGNALDGIEVHAVGMVKASKLFGENNGDHGVLLNNTYGPSYITLSGESIVRHNGMDGLRIVTPGKITVSKLTSEGNEWDGMVLISDNGDVSLSTIISRNNRGTGLAVLAHNGNVTLTNVVSMNNGADNNDAHGAWIDGVNLGTVTIKYSVFMTNEGSGIHLKTGVPYTIYKTYYFGNDRNGNGNPNIGFH